MVRVMRHAAIRDAARARTGRRTWRSIAAVTLLTISLSEEASLNRSMVPCRSREHNRRWPSAAQAVSAR